MAGKKSTMRENISSRPTDSSGRRATNADLGIGAGVNAARKAAAEKIMAREGTTSAAGGRPAKERNTLREAVLKIAPSKPVKILAIKMPVKQQVIRTTTAMKPTPARERNSIRETRKK